MFNVVQALPGVIHEVFQRGVESEGATVLVKADEEIFTNNFLHHVEVRLLPQLVALTEVGAEVVLVLHHVPGDAQADGGRRRGSQDTRQSVLPAGVVITRLGAV